MVRARADGQRHDEVDEGGGRGSGPEVRRWVARWYDRSWPHRAPISTRISATGALRRGGAGVCGPGRIRPTSSASEPDPLWTANSGSATSKSGWAGSGQIQPDFRATHLSRLRGRFFDSPCSTPL